LKLLQVGWPLAREICRRGPPESAPPAWPIRPTSTAFCAPCCSQATNREPVRLN